MIEYKGKKPAIANDCFIASNAVIAGNVTLRERVSIWYSAVLRAEAAPITVGAGSNIQDNCTLHTDEGFPSDIGEGVSVGHGAVLHGATVGSNCLIGMGAILLNGSRIGANCIIGAGSLVLQGMTIDEGMLVLGSPAKAARKLSEEEIKGIAENARHYDVFRAEYLKSDVG